MDHWSIWWIQRNMNIKNIVLILQCNAGSCKIMLHNLCSSQTSATMPITEIDFLCDSKKSDGFLNNIFSSPWNWWLDKSIFGRGKTNNTWWIWFQGKDEIILRCTKSLNERYDFKKEQPRYCQSIGEKTTGSFQWWVLYSLRDRPNRMVYTGTYYTVYTLQIKTKTFLL